MRGRAPPRGRAPARRETAVRPVVGRSALRSKRALAAVVGFPVRHSLSPRVFACFSRACGTPVEYLPLTLPPAGFAAALGRAKRGRFVGWNVTLPHKLEAMRLADRLDASALRCGAVNVLRFVDGRAIGYNTDGRGFWLPLARAGFVARSRAAVVLGAGGAARAAAAELASRGLAELMILNRSVARARDLARRVGGRAGRLRGPQAARAIARADLVVNATSLGMDGLSSPIPPGTRFKPGAVAYDLVYRPARTKFLQIAARGGARPLGGLSMLVAQAAETWRIWFGRALPGRAVRAAELDLAKLLSREEARARREPGEPAARRGS